MTIPKHLMEAKICNRDTCAEVEQLNSLVNSCQKEIRRLKEENQKLKKDYETIVSDNCDYLLLEKENQRLNDDIKILLKENEAKEKVIIKYDNVLNELEKLTISICENCYEDKETERIKKRINELKESNNGQ